MWLGFILGLALCVGLIWFVLTSLLNDAGKRAALGRCFDQKPVDWWEILRLLTGGEPRVVPSEIAVVVEPEPEPPPPPVVEIQLPPPSRGNIRPVHEESKDPEQAPPNLHLFPAVPPAETWYEEFNRRLFVHSATPPTRAWPDTTLDDFPTLLSAKDSDLVQLCNTHLRPGYPVIIDYYGWWKGASDRLEQDDTYIDPVITAYFGLPADRRPVVVTSPRPAANGSLLFLRYGFEPYRLSRAALDPHLTESLKYVLGAFTGPRNGWMWFSVARMRKAVMTAHRAALALAAERQREVEIINHATREAAQRRHANRFAALWDIPLDERRMIGDAAPTEQPTESALGDSEPSPQPEANSDATASLGGHTVGAGVSA